MADRIQPPRCADCGTTPTLCSSCGDYQCRCPVPWLVSRKQRVRIVPRVHYDKLGKPYRSRFIGSAPDESTYRAEIEELIEAPFS